MRTSGSWAKSNERILVIADSQDMRDALMGVLGAAGFVVFEQPSAIGATRAIRENEIRAVVIDVNVPGIRCDKLLSVLRENPRLQGLVVVVVAAEDENPELDRTGVETAEVTIEKSDIELRLAPLLARLLRKSSFRPQEAFSMHRS